MISFVYFDVGGVTIKDLSSGGKWEKLQYDLGIDPNKRPNLNSIWKEYESQVNLNLDVDELVPILKNELKLDLPDNYSILDEFINRFEPNPSIWSIVEKCKSFAKVGLLTNMHPRMFEKIKEAGLLPQFDWDVVIDSSVEMVAKPDLRIYQLAETRADVPGQEILFVDNLEKNLLPAASLNWKTFWYDSSDYDNSSKQLMKFIEGDKI